jgi:hypothetical protein
MDSPEEYIPAMTEPQPIEESQDRIQHIDRLVQRTQHAVLTGVEEMVRRQMEPFLDQTRQTILSTVEQMVHKHGDTLLGRVKGITLEIAEEMLLRQIEPFLDRARSLILEGLENASFAQKYADHLAAGLKKFARETVIEVLQVQVPAYSRRAGRRVLEYAVAGTLLCLAVILLLLGGIRGLQSAGVPDYATYLAGGLIAGGAGLFLLRMGSRPSTNSATTRVDQREDRPALKQNG